MALRAMSLGRVPGADGSATKLILLMGDRLKMARIAASWVAAEMVEFMPLGDLADQLHVGGAVGVFDSTTIPGLAVAIGATVAEKDPAFVGMISVV